MFVIDFFKSPRRLEAENLFLRHQLRIALRRAPPLLSPRPGHCYTTRWDTIRTFRPVCGSESPAPVGRVPTSVQAGHIRIGASPRGIAAVLGP
jgi:hypothetical protein